MKRLVMWYLTVLSVLSVASVLALRLVWPEHYPSGLFLIPLYFAIMLGVMLLLYRSITGKGRDRSYFFMAYRMVKIMLALILILVYFRVVASELMAFTIVFMSFYLCLTAVETVLFIKEEKKS